VARRQLLLGAAGVVVLAAVAGASSAAASSTSSSEYIVAALDGTTPANLASIVTAAGGNVLATLPVGSMLTADLTPGEAQSVGSQSGIEVTPDVPVSAQGKFTGTPGLPAAFPQQSGATALWAKNDTGSGINVAVLDTGIQALPDFTGRLAGGVDLTGGGNPFYDAYGHGTFVAGLIAGNGASSGGQYTGEAPGAGLVSVKVAGSTGQTDLATVIEGVDWTIEHASALNIRILNMSLGFQPFESTTLNPLDQVVQQAWNAGIVVVASAGNAGPFNGTILSPGDDPLVITVGSVDDQGQANPADDLMSAFSSVGPTNPDGWAKPDLVTSGRSIVSLRVPGSTVDVANPNAEVGSSNFEGTGTSFSAAIAAGAAALILSAHRTLRPNAVKASMLWSASPGPVGNPFVDGHGVLNAAAAVQISPARLHQSFGDAGGSLANDIQISPRDTIEAGHVFNMPGTHPQATISGLGAEVVLPVSCTPYGAATGWITVGIDGGPYNLAQNSTATVPTGDETSAASFEGSIKAPDLCSGGVMYNRLATYSAEITSTDTNDPVDVRFHYIDATTRAGNKWSTAIAVTPASVTAQGTTVNLAQLWSQSSWNPHNWSGVPPLVPAVTGTAWNGTAWNGSDWNGTAWDGTAWNGAAWSGAAWNGNDWSGTAWNGTAWNGTAWNGAAWNGTAWNSDLWG
jgi:serine protease AprX